jgi:hypothetical protein
MDPQPNADAVHPHDHCYVFDVMHMNDVLGFEGWQHLFDTNGQQLFAFLVSIGNYEAVYMNQGHFIGVHLLGVVRQNIEEFDGIYRQVHVDVVRVLKLRVVAVFLSVYFAHGFSSTHVPANNSIFDFIEFAIESQIFMAVRVQIVSYDIQTLFGSADSQWTHATEDIS